MFLLNGANFSIPHSHVPWILKVNNQFWIKKSLEYVLDQVDLALNYKIQFCFEKYKITLQNIFK